VNQQGASIEVARFRDSTDDSTLVILNQDGLVFGANTASPNILALDGNIEARAEDGGEFIARDGNVINARFSPTLSRSEVPFRGGSYTLATLPAASSFSGYLITVSDAVPAHSLCESDGTDWINKETGLPVAIAGYGTFTPTFRFLDGPPDVVYTLQEGYYAIKRDTYDVWVKLEAYDINTADTSAVSIQGFPFTMANSPVSGFVDMVQSTLFTGTGIIQVIDFDGASTATPTLQFTQGSSTIKYKATNAGTVGTPVKLQFHATGRRIPTP
jgi:hypothetical protein